VTFVVALAVSAALISTAVDTRRPVADTRPGPLVTVQMAGGSTFFEDSGVRAELRRRGIALASDTSLGSRQICAEPSLAARFDVADSGSQDAAACVTQKLRDAGRNPVESNPFSTPMVILTYNPIVKLLKTLHLVTQAGRITIFNVRAYLRVVDAGTQWVGIRGNRTYPNDSRILLWTADPRFANSGGMFAAIAYSAQNANGDPVTDVQPGDHRLAVIRKSFTELGSLDIDSTDLLRKFLTEGMDAYPMIMVYESYYIQALLDGLASPQSGITVMYPDPDVISDSTLVSWTPHGNQMTALLATPALAAIEEQHGYRTSRDSSDSSGFVRYMAARGITVPSLNTLSESLQFVRLPTEASLQKLIDAVTPG
jgi:hypothetical protein